MEEIERRQFRPGIVPEQGIGRTLEEDRGLGVSHH